MRIKVMALAGLTTALAAILTLSVFMTGSGVSSGSIEAAGAQLDLDMDATNGTGACSPIDTTASVAQTGTFKVAVCLTNPGTVPVAGFGYKVNYNDTIIVAPEVADVGTALDDNPDANVGTTTFSSPDLGSGWDCTGGVGANPKGDFDGIALNGTGAAYSGGCASAAGPNTLLQGPLGVITFNALSTPGTTALSISEASVTDNDLVEIGSCNPTVDTAMVCNGGSVDVTAPPTNTPVPPTVTPTNTPIPPTATNTPAGPTVNKDPNLANLFLCEGVTCVNQGEGSLSINEVATNISEPLGAWEIQVKFDHKIFDVSIDPNEALFTDYNRVPTCSIQVVTENWVLFGCVSTGDPADGFVGSGPVTLATLVLTPNADLKFRLHPGNDNGVVRMLLDENCEIANSLGHPEPGAINGGLTLECGDAAITVRILEGDLNLDCSVDVLDQQAIAFRYGTFFGNIFYDPWYDLEPALKDFDIDIKDLQKVFGRDGSSCAIPIPDQDPVPGLSVGPL